MSDTEETPEALPAPPHLGPEFLDRVRTAIRPKSWPSETARQNELEALRSEEHLEDYKDALVFLMQDTEHQFTMRKLVLEELESELTDEIENPVLHPDDVEELEEELEEARNAYADWKKRASTFKFHLSQYLSEAKRLARDRNRRNHDFKRRYEALAEAVEEHRDAVVDSAEENDTAIFPADEELWTAFQKVSA